MLPNEHAPEPVVPITSSSRAREATAAGPPSRPGDRRPHCRHLRHWSRRRPSRAVCRQLRSTGGQPDAAAGPTDDGVDDFGLVREAWDLLHEKYVGRDTLDDRELAYGAIDGLADAVGDTGHTDFMTPEERTSRNDALSGLRGDRRPARHHGQRRAARGDRVPRQPGRQGGLRTGDVILEVDGVPLAARSTTSSSGSAASRGPPWSSPFVRARMARPGTLKIERGEVEIDAVSWTMIRHDHRPSRIEQFSHRVAEDVQAALRELREEARTGWLDLRGNPGGYVGEAVGTASQFLSSGTVYVERNAQGEEKATPVSPDASGPTCR